MRFNHIGREPHSVLGLLDIHLPGDEEGEEAGNLIADDWQYLRNALIVRDGVDFPHPEAHLIFLRVDETCFIVGAKNVLGEVLNLLMVFALALHRQTFGCGHHLQTLCDLGIVIERSFIHANYEFAADEGIKLGGDFGVTYDDGIVPIEFAEQIEERGLSCAALIADQAKDGKNLHRLEVQQLHVIVAQFQLLPKYMLHQGMYMGTSNVRLCLIRKRVIQVITISNNRLIIDMGRHVDESFIFVNVLNLFPPEIIDDSLLATSDEFGFHRTCADVGLLNDFEVVVTDAHEIADGQWHRALHLFLFLIVDIEHFLVEKLGILDYFSPASVERINGIEREVTLEAFILPNNVHAVEIDAIDGFLREVLQDFCRLVTIGFCVEQVVKTFRVADKPIRLDMSKLNGDCRKIGQQITRVNGSIIEYAWTPGKITPLGKIFHGDIEAVAVVKNDHFLYMASVDEQFDILVQLMRAALRIVRDRA